jgi:predicted esterase
MKLLSSVFFLFTGLVTTEYGNAQSQPCQYGVLEGFRYCEITNGEETGNNNLPLVVLFHYSSSTPEELLTYFDSLTVPVRLILPRGNHRKRGGYSYYIPDHYAKDSVTQKLSVKQTADSVAAFIKAIGKKYKTRPVVSGISQGGDLSLLLAFYYPQLIKASFPIAGFVHRQAFDDFKKAPAKSVPVFIFQGEDDPIVSLKYTQREVAVLSKVFRISLFTYPKTGHDVSPEMKKAYSSLISKWARD